MSISESMRTIRKSQKLSQAEIGVLVAYHLHRTKPISQSTISRWENGTLEITPDVILAYALISKCDSSAVFPQATIDGIAVEFDNDSAIDLKG
jgi:transcriptional regulator with XRE-family HTH domain